MTFSYNESDLSLIIKRYSRDKNNYMVEYLDGSASNYLCSSISEDERLKSKMINQAIDRQKNMDIKNIEMTKQISLLTSIFACICASALTQDSKNILTLLIILVIMASIYSYRSNSRKIKELKKYKLFLEMVKDLDSINNSDMLKSIEPENIYQKPFDINTLDEYSYSEVKTLYKEYKKLNKK